MVTVFIVFETFYDGNSSLFFPVRVFNSRIGAESYAIQEYGDNIEFYEIEEWHVDEM